MMPNWDDPRGPRHGDERDRRRRDLRERREWPGGERRADQDRYGARYDDPAPGRYGRYEDAGEAAYRRRVREDAYRFGDTSPTHGGEPYAYGGQEYGLEGHPGVGDAPSGPGWGFVRGERRRNFDWEDPGVGQSQAGYGAAARSHPDEARSHPEPEFDPDYLRWRDEQLRAHDRDYQDWRREQHRQYDEQYRQFRSERQRHFGQAFHEWRSQRSAVGGTPDTTIGSVGQGQGGYGDKTGVAGGYNAASAVEKPSGMLDPPGRLSADPASQTGGTGQAASGEAREAGGSAEFGKEPGPVQAAAEGDLQGRDREARRRDGDAESRRR
jgi:hypothetical protein